MFCTLENIQGRERATTGYGCHQRIGGKDCQRKHHSFSKFLEVKELGKKPERLSRLFKRLV